MLHSFVACVNQGTVVLNLGMDYTNIRNAHETCSPMALVRGMGNEILERGSYFSSY